VKPDDPTKPLPRPQDEAYAVLLAKGDKPQIKCFLEIWPHAAKWKADAQHTKASHRADKVWARVEHLRKKAEDQAVADIRERRLICTRIMREIGNQDPADYIEGGADGAYITFGKESPNRLAVQSLKSRTIMIGEGDGAKQAVITEIRLRPTSEALAAIDILNKLDGAYRDKPTEDLTNTLGRLIDTMSEQAFGPPHLQGK